ncbi:zinc finger, CCHC-type containing protein [Tanacetum coccineum]
MAISGGKIQKANKKSLKAKGKGKVNGKRKDKQVYIPKPKNQKPTAKEHPAKDDTCHHCKELGHWKRNCPVYLAELLKKMKQVGTASSSVSKRRAFWSLNEDILKITILKTNTPYPSRKIRRIRACNHQRPQGNKGQYAISRRPIRRIGNME